jgi:hypothetical protein
VTFGEPGAEESATVIGVVGDFEVDGYTPPLGIRWIYRPVSQGHPIAVRAVFKVMNMDPTALGAIRHAAVELRGDAVGLDELVALERVVNYGLSGPRFNTAALAALAAFSLFLAALGLYGVVASAVVERTREIGIRMALGATARDVLRHVSRGAIIVVLIGTGAGIAGALAATRVLRTMLYGTSPTDPLVFLLAPLVLILVALVATFVPARHATTLDPVVALRSE